MNPTKTQPHSVILENLGSRDHVTSRRQTLTLFLPRDTQAGAALWFLRLQDTSFLGTEGLF